eukprot:TRINITY_DN4614_c0_g1_i1.p1 TRINITY_DN4614_c0_g1~~TRINITY_DN4614_c0_g1_i1.p1  ORF type:complete len:359 (-),score=61.40 TRINITY_DN4614_c0_g1_i1:29-1105(-)
MCIRDRSTGAQSNRAMAKNLNLSGLHLLRSAVKSNQTTTLAQFKDRLSVVPHHVPHQTNAIDVKCNGVAGLLTAIVQDKSGSSALSKEIEDSFIARGFDRRQLQDADHATRSFLRKPVRVFYLSKDWGNDNVDDLILAGSVSKSFVSSPTSASKSRGSLDIEAILFNRERLFLKEKMEPETKEVEMKDRIKLAESLIEYKEFVRCSSGFARSVLICAWCLGGTGNNIFDIPKGAEREYFEMHYNNAKLYASRLAETTNFASSKSKSGFFTTFVPYQLKKMEVTDKVVIRGSRTLEEDSTLIPKPSKPVKSKLSKAREAPAEAAPATYSVTPTGSVSQELLAFLSSRDSKEGDTWNSVS